MFEKLLHLQERAAARAGRLKKCLPWLAALALFSSACLPPPPLAPTLPPTLTATATITPSPTTTIIWFPPTHTSTPFPTVEFLPTEDLRPVLGATILEDQFTDQSAWPTMRTAAGSVAFGNQELTLAVAAPEIILISLRQAPVISDFYLEIDAEPSLCRGDDVYGIVLRAASTLDYYRLLVTCNGQLRMERLKDGRSLPIQDWMVSGQVPPGGMMPLRLGIWAFNDEMRVYINDIFQFSVRDPVWTGGQVGVFARSAGDTPLTVSFSRLVLYELPGGRPPPPMPTARPVTPTPPVVSSPTAAPGP